jgi:hypothetical protein
MNVDWRSVISDPNELKIFQALEDQKWDWRTVKGLARQSNLADQEVRRVLVKYPNLIRRSRVPTATGDEVYTLQERYFERKGFLDKVWTFTSGSSASST